MSSASNQWGVELNGEDQDKEVWRALLKPPFDPYVEEVDDNRGAYPALRSKAFDGLATSGDVHQVAKQLFQTLNVAMGQNADTDPVRNGAIVEFVAEGQPRRYHLLEAEGITVRFRVGMPTLTVSDADGNVIEPPQVPSKAQLWMRAAMLEPNIGSALRYLDGAAGWFELYKAYEALKPFPKGGIIGTDVKRFTQTANVGQRHHPKPKDTPNPKPMELWEARALITRWISAAVDDVLGRHS